MITPSLVHTFTDPFLCAASGIEFWNEHFYVVSDDELTLLKLSQDLAHRQLITLFEGTLPENQKERKKRKPDLETLTLLPDHQRLLCLPSGSRPNRTKAALVDARGPVILELQTVFKTLAKKIPELNIEGAYVRGNCLKLLQRGNGRSRFNAILSLDLDRFLRDEVRNLEVSPVDLGSLRGTPLSFTEGVLVNGEEWFLAVAEATESTYEDGAFIGAVLGKMAEGKVILMEELNLSSKPEGLTMCQGSFYLVTDDDDRKKPSEMYKFALHQ